MADKVKRCKACRRELMVITTESGNSVEVSAKREGFWVQDEDSGEWSLMMGHKAHVVDCKELRGLWEYGKRRGGPDGESAEAKKAGADARGEDKT